MISNKFNTHGTKLSSMRAKCPTAILTSTNTRENKSIIRSHGMTKINIIGYSNTNIFQWHHPLITTQVSTIFFHATEWALLYMQHYARQL